MVTSLEPSEKWGQIVNLQSSTYHTVKIGPVDPQIMLLNGQFIFKKKKLTQAKHIARGACMPCELNKLLYGFMSE